MSPHEVGAGALHQALLLVFPLLLLEREGGDPWREACCRGEVGTAGKGLPSFLCPPFAVNPQVPCLEGVHGRLSLGGSVSNSGCRRPLISQMTWLNRVPG